MKVDLEINRDRYIEINGVAEDEDGNIMSIADPVKLIFRMVNVEDDTQLVEKTTAVPAEITKTNPSAGEYTIYIKPVDTKNLDPGKYRYEVLYEDDPSSPNELLTLNPKENETSLIRLVDVLIEV